MLPIYLFDDLLTVIQTVAPLALIFAWVGANFKGYTMKVRIYTGKIRALLTRTGIWKLNRIGRLQYRQYYRSSDISISRCTTVSHEIIVFCIVLIQNRYMPAKITLVAVNAAAMVVVVLLRTVYGLRNARANRSGTPARSFLERRMAGTSVVQDVHDDRNFRYVY